jgi:glycerophosphoryl diester phosphodiesterase
MQGHHRTRGVLICLFFAVLQAPSVIRSAEPRKLVAHRGASAYAPEHTLAAYRLAIDQGADYVEQDLAVTSDGVLICLHDDTLERTTDVEEVFPSRFVLNQRTGAREWLAVDFTLDEIKRLDAAAGSIRGSEESAFRHGPKLCKRLARAPDSTPN